MNDNGSAIFNYANSRRNVSLTGTTWGQGGLVVDTTGGVGSILNTRQEIINSSSGTIIFHIKGLAEITALRNQRFCGASELQLQKRSGGQLRFRIYNGVTDRYIYIDAANVPNWQSGTVIAIEWNIDDAIFDGKKMACSVDGVYVTPSSSANATSLDIFDIPSPFSLYNHFLDTNRYLDAIVYYNYFYGKQIGIERINSVCENPYAMFYQPNILSNFIGAFAPSAGLTRRNQIFGSNAFPIGLGV